MIDVTIPFFKTKYFLCEEKINYDDIDDILTMLDEYRHAHIISAYKLENEEYLYMKSINSTLNDFTEKEQVFIRNMLDVFYLPETKFSKVPLELNTFCKFIKTNYMFAIENDDKIAYRKQNVEYFIIPKHLSTGHLRIDEQAILGPIRFLKTLKQCNSYFTIEDLSFSIQMEVNRTNIISIIKKLLLSQYLVISDVYKNKFC